MRFLRAAGPLTAVVLGTFFVKLFHPPSISIVRIKWMRCVFGFILQILEHSNHINMNLYLGEATKLDLKTKY